MTALPFDEAPEIVGEKVTPFVSDEAQQVARMERSEIRD